MKTEGKALERIGIRKPNRYKCRHISMKFLEVYATSKVMKTIPFVTSVPHSGEQVPSEVTWLQGLSEPHLMRDVDRYVDQLYNEILQELEVTCVTTPWHRYVVDLNRSPDEYDEQSVASAQHQKGTHPKGLHWSVTTQGEPLILEPMTLPLHEDLVKKYFEPFHQELTAVLQSQREKFGCVYHCDLHSMPSLGTPLHPDPGEQRADIVVSDQHGASCETRWMELVRRCYEEQGFHVAYNWPYVGGGVTKRYGRPSEGTHTVQVELNRKLYMDEATKKKSPDFASTRERLHKAIRGIHSELEQARWWSTDGSDS